MQGHQQFFHSVADIYQKGGVEIAKARQEAEFLAAMNYVEIASDSIARDDAQFSQNRLTLLRLAAKLERVFQLPLPYAPGACFFGGVVAPGKLSEVMVEAPPAGVAGRGTNIKQAFETCLGETAEYISFFRQIDDPLILPGDKADGPAHGLSPEALTWALSGIGAPADMDPGQLDWIECRAIADKEAQTLFPAELILRQSESPRPAARQAESTGTGAGPTLEAAITSGLLEVIERDAFALWWFGGNPAGTISPAMQEEHGFLEFAAGIRRNARRTDWLLDISTEIGIPVIAALSSPPDGGGVVAGFCANPDIGQAMRGAFLELCQMELAQEISLSKARHEAETTLNDQDRIWIARHEKLCVNNYPQLLGSRPAGKWTTPMGDNDLDTIVGILTNNGFSAFFADLTRSAIDIPVAKAIIPGLQSSKPDCISNRLKSVAHRNRVPLSARLQQLTPL